ncbi:exosortase [Geobacter pickeringii]|uniref:Membrane protein n=1 Tax=Geobacter pickeringii TaxID=345632 RepID=A0A0B5BG36_9BACT|nr:exosortase [Geobacter pickeringii]AJE03480.1 membrane protein [Geobacter pickeringii]
MSLNDCTISGNERTGGEGSLRLYIFLGIFAVTFSAAYYPVMAGLIQSWAASDDYSHGFLIVPLALYITWLKRDELGRQPVSGSWTGLLLVVLSLCAFLFAQVGGILTLSSLSLIVTVWGAVLFLFGFGMLRQLLFPLFLLLFMIPVPAQIYAALTTPLQLFVSKVAVEMASLAGIPVYREGNVIHHTQGVFQVVQACSGMRSIMALLTLGALLAYFGLRSSLPRGVLFVSAIPIAVAINVLRVFTIIAAFHFLGLDLAEGTPHTVLGIVLFGIAFVLFVAIRKGLSLCERSAPNA